MKTSCSNYEKENGKRFVAMPSAVVICTVMFSAFALAQSDTIQTDVPALKDVFAKDFTIGCLLSYTHVGFSTDPYVPDQSTPVAPNGGSLIRFHMNSMSPGNNMKPQYTVDLTGSASAHSAAATQMEKDSIDVHPIVKFNGNLIAQLNWAKRQGFTFRGHTLVWHSQTPGTGFFRTGYSALGARLAKGKMTERLDNYIKEVIRLIHEGWPGLLSAIDVVNEAVTDAGGDRTTDPQTGSEWYVTFGDISYVMKAFELTRKHTVAFGESQIKLYYNDYNTHNASKADGIVRICTPIYQAGYLDGIGMQEHDANTSPTAEQWIASYNKFDPICTEMAVTELDVTTGSANPSSSTLATQANQYGQLFKCFVERSYKSGRGKIINVSKDGLNDQYTFKTSQSSSLWDALNKCKPSFYAVVNVGLHFNALDSIITYAETLQQVAYTAPSWSAFAAALTSAKSTKNQNYSTSISADAGLSQAKADLKASIDGLMKIVNAVDHHQGSIPTACVLSQNYPNPFNPTTVIEFAVPKRAVAELSVYNLLGEKIAVLVNGELATGTYTARFDASSLPSGVYFYQMRTGEFVESKRMTLVK